MKIVIDIPKNIKEALDNDLLLYDNLIRKAIKNGKVIPKGHGRIADVDELLKEMKATRTYDIPFALERIKPIIEADR